MRIPRGAAAWLTFLLLLTPAVGAFALKVERLAHFSPASGQTYALEVAAGSAIVRFKPGVSAAAGASVLEAAGFSVENSFERFGWSLVKLPAGLGVSSGLERLKAIPQVESADPNRVYRAKRAPSDAYAVRQYALARVQAFGAWEYETGFSSRATIAFIDTGIDGSHPELAGKLTLTNRVFDPFSGAASNDAVPATFACNHATRGGGVAAAASDNSAGVAGMSWGAQLLSLKVFDDLDCNNDCSDAAGYGSCSTSETAIAAAVNDAIPLHNTASAGKVIINMSLGSPGGCSVPLQNAVNAAVASGLLLVAAAGNDGSTVIDSPANCSGVIPVGATDLQDGQASFSNSGTELLTTGLSAPGVDIYTSDINGGYASATGTSFASPMTAGLAALVWSAAPNLTAAAVFTKIKNSTDDLGDSGPDRDFGWGRINAYKAICSVVPCRAYSSGAKKAVAYPNPFRPKTHNLLAFKIAETLTGAELEVEIYTSEGELVKKLEGLAWDGKNEAGAPVASGVYLFRVKTDKDSAVGKFALLR